MDPSNGDVYATMLYDDLTDSSTTLFPPKVTRFTSTDGGLPAVDTTRQRPEPRGRTILKMPAS